MIDEEAPEDELPETPVSSVGAAMALALDAASRAKADAFLDEQTAFIRVQKEHLHEQRLLLLSHLKWRRISDWMRVGWQSLLALFVAAIAIGAGFAVWTAARDHALVIESFSVPPDLAARGLTGQTVAAQLLDKLQAMQDATKSARPADSYSNNWGDEIKVEIPETGVSIGEVHKLLVSWIGHETHITGEIFHTAAGLVVTARAGGDGGATVTGSEADLDKLLQEAAEKIYQRTQPYRYSVYLLGKTPPQVARSRQLLEGLAADGSPRERAWAYVGLSSLDSGTGNEELAISDSRQTLALIPDFVLAYQNIDTGEVNLGHDEAALAAARSAVAVLRHGGGVDMNERARQVALPSEQETVDFALNDFTAARADSEQLMGLPSYNGSVENGRHGLIVSLAMLHDGAAARRAMSDLPPAAGPPAQLNRAMAEFAAAYWMGEWPAVVSLRASIERQVRDIVAALGGSTAFDNKVFATQFWPYAASAMAEMGDFKGAHALIDQTPLDCYACVRARGDIDAAEKNWGGAAYWFADAVRQAPSIPMGYYHWGRMLLAKGDRNGAIAKFRQASAKGPHFADPLEAWGEALILKNRSDLALVKFQQANLYAPAWGRLHLKWGEAQFWLGQKDEARRQFAAAAKLDLSPAERAELTRMAHG